MKRLFALFLVFVLAGCASQGFSIRQSGDGIYHARSMSAYSYVNGYFGFPYYGPWDWSWYYPVWYSPMMGHHYSWYCPPYFWADPIYRPVGGFAYHDVPPRQRPSGQIPVEIPGPKPIMPVDLRRAVIGPSSPAAFGKPMAWGSSEVKNRAYAKKYGTPGSYPPGNSYRKSMPSGAQLPATRSSRYGSPRAPSRPPPPRQPSMRSVSENIH